MANIVSFGQVENRDFDGNAIDVQLSAVHVRRPIPSGWPWRSSSGASSDRPTTGQQWPRGMGGSGAYNVADLDALNDVTLTAPAANNVLTYDAGSSQWVNSAWKITHYNDSCTFTGSGDTHDFTITPVADMAKSFIIPTIGSPDGSTIGVVGFVDASTVRFTMTSGPNPQAATVNFYVIELP